MKLEEWNKRPMEQEGARTVAFSFSHCIGIEVAVEVAVEVKLVVGLVDKLMEVIVG